MPLLVGAVLLVSLGLAGAATAVPADDSSINEQTIGDDADTSNDTTDDGVGICVTGVDSECNGEENDGDNESAASDKGERIGSGDGESGDVGICMTGVDSECNSEENDGDNESAASDKGERIGSGDDDGGQVGICVTGVDSECNSENNDGDEIVSGEDDGNENDGTPAHKNQETGSDSGSSGPIPSTGSPFGFLSALLSMLF